MEVWKDVVGYEGLYEVSNTGRVRSWHKCRGCTGIILSHSIANAGYPMVSLHKDREQKAALIHRLVAEAFIPNPDNLPVVDHINGDRSDNRVENLRWSSHYDNNYNRPEYRELLQEIQELRNYIAYLESRA